MCACGGIHVQVFDANWRFRSRIHGSRLQRECRLASDLSWRASCAPSQCWPCAACPSTSSRNCCASRAPRPCASSRVAHARFREDPFLLLPSSFGTSPPARPHLSPACSRFSMFFLCASAFLAASSASSRSLSAFLSASVLPTMDCRTTSRLRRTLSKLPRDARALPSVLPRPRSFSKLPRAEHADSRRRCRGCPCYRVRADSLRHRQGCPCYRLRARGSRLCCHVSARAARGSRLCCRATGSAGPRLCCRAAAGPRRRFRGCPGCRATRLPRRSSRAMRASLACQCLGEGVKASCRSLRTLDRTTHRCPNRRRLWSSSSSSSSPPRGAPA